MCRRQIVNMVESILARFSRINTPRHGFRYAERDIFAASAAPIRIAGFQDARFIVKQAPDRAFVEQPQLGQLLRRIVPLERGFLDANCGVVTHREEDRCQVPAVGRTLPWIPTAVPSPPAEDWLPPPISPDGEKAGSR